MVVNAYLVQKEPNTVMQTTLIEGTAVFGQLAITGANSHLGSDPHGYLLSYLWDLPIEYVDVHRNVPSRC